MLLKKNNPDYWTFLIVVVLLGIGIVVVFSASQYFASYEPYNDSYYFLKRQCMNAALGIVSMIILMNIDYHLYRKFSVPILFLGLALVIAVLIMGVAAKGAVRWIEIGPLRFQPSEIMKLCLIIFLSSSLSSRQKYLTDFKNGFLPYVVLIGIVFILVALENLSTGVIIAGTAWIMMFCAGNKMSHLFSLVGLGAVAITILILAEGFRGSRITAFLDPWADPQGNGYQTIQSMVAIGSGGLTGVGLGSGGAKWFYLPDRHTDFIFSILAEEMGLIGGLVLVFAVFGFCLAGIGHRLERFR